MLETTTADDGSDYRLVFGQGFFYRRQPNGPWVVPCGRIRWEQIKIGHDQMENVMPIAKGIGEGSSLSKKVQHLREYLSVRQ